METLVFLFTTLVAIISSMYLFALSRVQYLKQHWVEYRCNPLYMPVAGLVGDNVVTNFTKCTMKGFHDYAGFVMDPIMAEFSVVNDTISEVGDTMHSIRTMMGGVRGGFLGILGTVFGKIQNVMSQFQYIIIRMRTLLGRVVGVMMSFLMVFYTGMETAGSVVNGPVGKTMSFLCFDSATTIRLKNGKEVCMTDLKLGDMLSNGAIVTSMYLIDGTGIPLYNIGGVRVTGTHKIKYGNAWLEVEKHPAAKKTSSVDRLVCLNTTTHRITIRSLEFLDFVECAHEDWLLFKRKYVEQEYNGHWDLRNETTYLHCPSGVLEHTRIALEGGKTVEAKHLQVGDRLIHGDPVLGIAYHVMMEGVHVVLDKGLEVSPSSWVFRDGVLHSAESIGEVYRVDNENWKIVIQIITPQSRIPCQDTKGNIVYLLDELESLEPSLYAQKDAILQTGRFRGKEIVV